jgi:signal transduction histidine kinase/CheY-like chemotaxis protein/ligand-binding sensor domain-containing protein
LVVSRSTLIVGLLALATVSVSAAPGDQLSVSTASATRHPEEGRPFIRAYQPLEIGGGSQTWAILQDRRGVMYFGTNGAILVFDGASWRRITIAASGGNSIRGLVEDADGRIWVASLSTFGYLAPDAAGDLKYVAVSDKLPKGTPEFADVWRMFVTPDGMFFQAINEIFLLSHDTFTVIPAKSRFGRAQQANGRIYVGTPEDGLNILEGTTLKPLPGTARIGAEAFPVVLPYDAHRLLVGTRRDGLFLYDGAALTAFATEVDPVFKTTQVYRGLVLPGPQIAIETTSAGLIILDTSGHHLMTVDRSNGLPSDTVYYALRDREGALWLAQDAGVARVEIPSPITYFNQSDGLSGGIQTASRIDGRLLVGLQSGAAYLAPGSPDGKTPPHFENILGTGTQCWAFTKMVDPAKKDRSAILLACGDALDEVVGSTVRPIKATSDLSFRPNVLLVSKHDPSRLWTGLFDGLESFRWVDGKWIEEGRVKGAGYEARSLFEEPNGTLWMGTSNDGALRLTLGETSQTGQRPAIHVDHFTEKDGLPKGSVTVTDVRGVPLFTGGLDDPRAMHFDASAGHFVRDTAFDGVVGVNLNVNGGFLVADPKGRVFLNLGRETAVLQQRPDHTWSVDKSMFARFGSTPVGGLFLDGDIVWLQFANGRLVRYDTAQKPETPPAATVLIRRVAGNRGKSWYSGDAAAPTVVQFKSDENALRFEFALPSYLDESATEYQSRLDGFDTDWSAWTHEPQREYTNLSNGTYSFRVRARGISGLVSNEAAYTFSVLPPWYRTWWAYAGYVALFGLVIAGAARVTRMRVVARERQRSQFAEAKLRADAAESLAKTESEGKKNVELLSEMGREITASLDFETIFGKLYDRVNELADADVFGVGLYHPDRHEIEYRLAIEKGKRYAPYTRDTTNQDQLPVWCIEHREPVFINDIATEASRYITSYHETSQRLEDGSMSQPPQSLIYLPLVSKDRVLGIITIQSLRKNAYTDHHLNVMQSLASYTAIALDNADAYRQLNEHEHEIRRLFEEAEKARSIAEEADAAKSAFLSTVSHELRTPLTSVLGFAKIIRKRLEDRIFPLVDKSDTKVSQAVKQVEDNLRVVVSEGERLTKLIDDVLDLAKIEAGKLEWHMESVDVADIIDRATAATSSLFDQKGLRLEKQVPSDLPSVTGDRDRLIQVVINLISNAVKFTSTGSVTCRVERRAGDLVVSVIDTGLGIAPTDQPKVFERFKQVGDTLTDKPKGTGLGLPICKEIVEHHAGRIWVESALGAGSTFSFSLPVTVEQGALPLTDRSGPVELAALIRQLRDQVIVTTPRTTERQPRILVVDDEANIRELLHQEFSEAGYAVTMASNGREAIAAVRRERPDLVVLDVMMPEMNGFDVAAVLKNDPATLDIPIVVLSIVQDRERGFRLGVDRYLTKPIDTDLLFKEVGLLIEQKKSHKRVMVVDEDASTVRTLTDVLTTRGYSVIEARSDDLLERAVASQPDIILLNSVSSARSSAVQMLRFEKGMENVLFLVYQ